MAACLRTAEQIVRGALPLALPPRTFLSGVSPRLIERPNGIADGTAVVGSAPRSV
jgi:hypothetical protein